MDSVNLSLNYQKEKYLKLILGYLLSSTTMKKGAKSNSTNQKETFQREKISSSQLSSHNMTASSMEMAIYMPCTLGYLAKE